MIRANNNEEFPFFQETAGFASHFTQGNKLTALKLKLHRIQVGWKVSQI